MVKRLSLSIVILLLMLGAGLYALRVPLSLWVLTPVAHKASLEITCLDWSVDSWRSVRVSELCLNYPSGKLRLKDISLNAERADISYGELFLKKSADVKQAPAPLYLPLPDKRPLLKIEELVVGVFDPGSRRKVRIEEKTLNHFYVSGDLDADIQLATHEITGRLHLKHWPKELSAIIPQLQSSVFSAQANWRYAGTLLMAEVALNSELSLIKNGCHLAVSSRGVMRGDYDSATKRFELDLSDLSNQLSGVQGCLEDIEKSWQVAMQGPLPDSWSLVIEDPVSSEHGVLKTGEIQLRSGPFSLNVQKADYVLSKRVATAQIEFTENENLNLTLQVQSDVEQGINQGHYRFGAIARTLGDITLESVSGNGTFIYAAEQGATAEAEFTADRARFVGYSTQIISGNIRLNLDNEQILHGDGKLSAQQIKGEQASATGLVHSFSLKGGADNPLYTANTQVETLMFEGTRLDEVDIETTLHLGFPFEGSHRLIWNNLHAELNHYQDDTATKFKLSAHDLEIAKLQPLVVQYVPALSLVKGNAQLGINGELNSGQIVARGEARLNGLDALYGDYLARGADTELHFNINSAGLNLAPASFKLDELRAGPVISDIKGLLEQQESAFILKGVQGGVFGGEALVDRLRLDNTQQTGAITLKNLDIEQLIALEKQSGIRVNGRIDGLLPYRIGPDGLEVQGGTLVSRGPGQLRIEQSPAFDAFKAKQADLADVLTLLEELDFEQVSGQVTLAEDGWLDVALALKGRNQSAEQDVNFNYTHRENIYTLFRAMRLGDEISKKIATQYQRKE